jgi:hypothetical protein
MTAYGTKRTCRARAAQALWLVSVGPWQIRAIYLLQMPEVALQAEELGIPQNAGSRGGTRCFYLAFKKLRGGKIWRRGAEAELAVDEVSAGISGHADPFARCLLLGVNRTCCSSGPTSANDPSRTSERKLGVIAPSRASVCG